MSVSRRGRGRPKVDLATRFAAKVAPRDAAGHELWTGGAWIGWKPRIKVDGVYWPASVVAWNLVHGEIPEGEVLHRLCDEPRCVAVAHHMLIDMPLP